MLLGSGLFAVVTWRVGALPRAGAAILVVGAVTVIPAIMGVMGGLLSEDVGRALSILAMSAFGGGWVLVGVGALRSGRPMADALGS